LGTNTPFYMLFNVAPSLAPYKVVWKEVSPELNTAVVGPFGGKIMIPAHTFVFVPCEVEDEAHFICAVLNSLIVRLVVNSYLHTHPSPHVMRYANVPKYDPDNPLHRELAELSKRAHQLARSGDAEGLREVEARIDELVAELYSITDEELIEMKKSLLILLGQIDEAKLLGALREKAS